MKETALERRMKDELRTLLNEIEAGQQPSNVALDDAVRVVLHRQQQIADRLKEVAA
jgi:hypothetical protein